MYLYQTQRLVITCAPLTIKSLYSYKQEDIKRATKKSVLQFQVFLSSTNNFQTGVFDPYIQPSE